MQYVLCKVSTVHSLSMCQIICHANCYKMQCNNDYYQALTFFFSIFSNKIKVRGEW